MEDIQSLLRPSYNDASASKAFFFDQTKDMSSIRSADNFIEKKKLSAVVAKAMADYKASRQASCSDPSLKPSAFEHPRDKDFIREAKSQAPSQKMDSCFSDTAGAEKKHSVGELRIASRPCEKSSGDQSLKADAEEAAALQEEADCDFFLDLANSLEAEQAMNATKSGRAWLFIERVIELQKELHKQRQATGKMEEGTIETVAVDDMVFLCEKFLECQKSFRDKGSPCKVTLGYHYTRRQNMDSIRQHGLMTRADRVSRTIHSRQKGAAFGDGIYTATNPCAFNRRGFGDMGLLVAILLGRTERLNRNSCRWNQINKVSTKLADTVIGNKRGSSTNFNIFHDEVVLVSSSQCLPLIRFSSDLIKRENDGNDDLWMYHQELQKVIDEFFNEGKKTKLERISCPGPTEAPILSSAAWRSLSSYTAALRGATTTAAAGITPIDVAASSTNLSHHVPFSVQASQHHIQQQTSYSMSKHNQKSPLASPFSILTQPIQHQSKQQPVSQTSAYPISVTWRSDSDIPARLKIIREIFAVLNERAKFNVAKRITPPLLSIDFLRNLPKLTKWFEEKLYMSAKSLAEYKDISTLGHRVNQASQSAIAHQLQQDLQRQSQLVPHQVPQQQQIQQQPQKDPQQFLQFLMHPHLLGLQGQPTITHTSIGAGPNVSRGATNPDPSAQPDVSSPSKRSLVGYSPPRKRSATALLPQIGALKQGDDVDGAEEKVEHLSYTAPKFIYAALSPDAVRTVSKADISQLAEECSICMESLQHKTTPACSDSKKDYDTVHGEVVSLQLCGHVFHRACIFSALKQSTKCPICRRCIQEPQGHSPSGTMTITKVPSMFCGGYYQCLGTIEICYSLKGGTQQSYHPNPGTRYSSSRRKAFLPNNDEGNKLLKRLKYAWLRGLSFSVGTSLTTGRQNTIVWSSIHHKTNLSGGPTLHGYPDPAYFANCNEELTALGVPCSEDCLTHARASCLWNRCSEEARKH